MTRQRSINASAWNLVGFGWNQALRLVNNIVLASILAPEAFGLMALVAVIMAGLQSFTDLGISPSLIMSSNAERPAFRSTAWTLTVVRGFALWIVVCMLAWPLSRLYDRQLLLILPVASLVLVLSAFQSTQLVMLQRYLRYREITILEIVTGIVWIVVSVALALALRSVWAMVIGTLVGIGLKTTLSWTLASVHRDTFLIDNTATRELVKFGKWIFVSTIITFIGMQVDRLLVGKLFSIEQLGVYSVALSLVVIPRELISRLASSVQFPILSRSARREARELRSAFAQTREPLLLCSLSMMLAIGLGAQGFFSLLYDTRYQEAAWITQLLCVPIFIGAVTQTAGYALLAVGDSRGLAMSNAVRAIAIVPACVVGYWLTGLSGFIGGIAFSAIAGYLAQAVALRRHGLHVVAADVLLSCLFVLLLWGPLWLAWRLPLLGMWHGIDLTVAALGAVVLVPLGLFSAMRMKSLMMQRRASDVPQEPDVAPAAQTA